MGSRLEKEGQKAMELLRQVSERHQGTPWGLLATRELQQPIGWEWTEDFTELNPIPENTAPVVMLPSVDDQMRMLPPPPPKRPLPKL